jgi:hypothetical protein
MHKKTFVLFWVLLLLLFISAILPLIAINQHIFISETSRIPGLKKIGEGIYFGERIAVFNFLLFFLLIIYRLFLPISCLQNLSNILNWINAKDHKRARLSIAFLVSITILAFIFKLHFIFALRGNPGWTYKNITLPTELEVPNYFPDTEPPRFLNTAISSESLKYQKHSGYLQGDAYFMHFKNGQILPFNLNLLRNTHPLGRFGYRLEKQQDALVSILLKTYTNLQRGYSTWLPHSIALPNHIVRQYIDYKEYPPSDQIVSLSVWKLLVRIDAGKSIYVSKALLSNEIVLSSNK